MLETMYSIALQKNNFSSKDADNNIINQNNSSKSIFNELNKYFMSKEIEFDNVFTKEKKDDDTTVISANFAINNLLNILNKKDIYSKNNFVRDDITKKN